MLDAGRLSPYIGFTEPEVQELCEKYGKDFTQVKRWYDGYLLERISRSIIRKRLWSIMLRDVFSELLVARPGTYEIVVPLINMDFDGLRNGDH